MNNYGILKEINGQIKGIMSMKEDKRKCMVR